MCFAFPRNKLVMKMFLISYNNKDLVVFSEVIYILVVWLVSLSASDLGLHCLPMSQTWDARRIYMR